MTDAQYWLTLCERQRPNVENPVNDIWCRRTLEDAAHQVCNTGFSGRTWFFPDGSGISANDDGVMLLPARGMGVES